MAGVGMFDVCKVSEPIRAPEWKPAEHYRSRAYKGRLYEPIKFRKTLAAPKSRVVSLHIPATNPQPEYIDKIA